MMAHNLCYSTLTSAAGVQQYNLQPDQYIRTPTNGKTHWRGFSRGFRYCS